MYFYSISSHLWGTLNLLSAFSQNSSPTFSSISRLKASKHLDWFRYLANFYLTNWTKIISLTSFLLTAVLTFPSCVWDAVSLQNQPHSIKKIPWDTLPTFSIIIANKHNLNTWIAHVTQPDIESPSQWSPAVTSCHRRITSLPVGVLCHGVVQVAVILHRSGLFYTFLSVTFNGRTRGLRYLVNTSIVIHTHSIVTLQR